LEPFYYEDGRIVLNSNEIHGEGIITNATVYGSENINFLDLRPHFLNDVFRLEIDMLIPKIFIKSYASGNANVLGIQAHGADTTRNSF